MPFQTYCGAEGLHSSVLESSHGFRSNFFNFTVQLSCPFKSIIYSYTEFRGTKPCEQIWIKSKTMKDNIEEFSGTCFKFSFMLSRINEQHALKVYFSKLERLMHYMNGFIIIAYMERQKRNDEDMTLTIEQSGYNTTVMDSSLKLFIKDEIHQDGEPLTFQFTGQQLPLVWKSYGQFLTIVVQTAQNLRQNLF